MTTTTTPITPRLLQAFLITKKNYTKLDAEQFVSDCVRWEQQFLEITKALENGATGKLLSLMG